MEKEEPLKIKTEYHVAAAADEETRSSRSMWWCFSSHATNALSGVGYESKQSNSVCAQAFKGQEDNIYICSVCAMGGVLVDVWVDGEWRRVFVLLCYSTDRDGN